MKSGFAGSRPRFSLGKGLAEGCGLSGAGLRWRRLLPLAIYPRAELGRSITSERAGIAFPAGECRGKRAGGSVRDKSGVEGGLNSEHRGDVGPPVSPATVA